MTTSLDEQVKALDAAVRRGMADGSLPPEYGSAARELAQRQQTQSTAANVAAFTARLAQSDVAQLRNLHQRFGIDGVLEFLAIGNHLSHAELEWIATEHRNHGGTFDGLVAAVQETRGVFDRAVHEQKSQQAAARAPQDKTDVAAWERDPARQSAAADALAAMGAKPGKDSPVTAMRKLAIKFNETNGKGMPAKVVEMFKSDAAKEWLATADRHETESMLVERAAERKKVAERNAIKVSPDKFRDARNRDLENRRSAMEAKFDELAAQNTTAPVVKGRMAALSDAYDRIDGVEPPPRPASPAPRRDEPREETPSRHGALERAFDQIDSGERTPRTYPEYGAPLGAEREAP